MPSYCPVPNYCHNAQYFPMPDYFPIKQALFGPCHLAIGDILVTTFLSLTLEHMWLGVYMSCPFNILQYHTVLHTPIPSTNTVTDCALTLQTSFILLKSDLAQVNYLPTIKHAEKCTKQKQHKTTDAMTLHLYTMIHMITQRTEPITSITDMAYKKIRGEQHKHGKIG